MSFAAMILVAIGCDLAFGWPNALYARIGHPVTWIGALIGWLDRSWNREGPARRLRGVAAALLVIGLTGGIALAVQLALPQGWPGILLGGILAWPLVALRSMHDHVVAVARPLVAGDLPAARHAVSMIVGRDPSRLDEAGVARAALESLAENSSDGIVAPLFWGVVAGLPGIAAYKAINTLDSMIGHRTPRHEEFGWASARIDDLVNLIPARLSGLLFALASGRAGRALACMMRDARHHRSPNAGWPEAAMAGALGVRLSGPRIYADRVAEEPWVNGACPDPRAVDLDRGLALYRRTMLGLTALIGALAVLGM
ncbi:adenosylcobinamide-phosphate synthase CbiB [Sedimentimonas flavescens]|uniref:adenosylcobinamide-phosphate synthase CbiB n=1 Tax=Sedimentimonas flavescens TaxID=2851012 RepID=UPI001C49CAF0|nr:adenosylcobinamide-phosphate synthase CbiB [Sedimentimonas flavescens]MBW0158040.1 adenosylcobinamide-phosphate synthase CbiB [Sedimentimonas flavescens]